jgi:hypothetical protein
MSHQLRFQVLVIPNVPWPQFLDRFVQAEELGFELDRDPASLRRSYLMFDPASRASGGGIRHYESDDVFVDIVRSITDLGITEVSLYYPAVEAQLPAFERIATEVLPVLRREHA